MPPLSGRLAKPRNRIGILCLLAAVIALGLASRKFPDIVPEFFAANAGDALWTIAVYLAVAIFFPAWSSLRLGIVAMAISFAVEFSQLLDVNFLNAIRGTTLGRLALGEGFLWIDLARYLSGAAIAMAVDYIWSTFQQKRVPIDKDEQSNR